MWNLPTILFYFFAAFALISALIIIITKNPVRAVLSLIVTFFSMGALWILMECEFLALTLVLVYVGAVMVLFLFVIMMLDVSYAETPSKFTSYIFTGICVFLFMGGGLIYAITSKTSLLHPLYALPLSYSGISQVKSLGTLLYTEYLYAFEIAGILLLVAIIAAISLTFRGQHSRKVTLASEQLEATKANRLEIVRMPSKGIT